MNRRMIILNNHKFRSIVEELSDYAPAKDRDLFIESRAQQVLASVGHLMRLIRESYDSETADDLQKRLVNAIRTEDEMKFRRKIRQIRESKEQK